MAGSLRRVRAATVFLWGKKVGAVAWNDAAAIASFEFEPAFLREGYEVSPILLQRRPGIFSFPALKRETFNGLPGLLADSLPDRYGNALIDVWLARKGRSTTDFSPVERLCYIGQRGMGALEFRPALDDRSHTSVPIEIGELAELAQRILDARSHLRVDLKEGQKAFDTIIRIGTSAGGARPKALIAWNPATDEVRSGQVPAPPGFEPWILKFDGVHDRTLGDSSGYGRIEYAYNRMAVDAGIAMAECRLLPEGPRAHFMTRRFDRTPAGEKLHMQSLCALAHFDFNMPGAYSYEQALLIMQQLGLGNDALDEMFRRMVFNVVARNQDDHTKNIAFLMDRNGVWELSTAFDVMWAYNSTGSWTNQHQMSLNGKRDGIVRADMVHVAEEFGIRAPDHTIDNVLGVIRQWPLYASEAGVPGERIAEIGLTHRTVL